VTDILNAAIALAGLTFGLWAIRWSIRAARQAGDYRSRGDRRAAWRLLHTDPPAIDTQPGTDTDLYLDAALAYYGPAGLQRLRAAINDHRTGEL
jgi:hypothetical protein